MKIHNLNLQNFRGYKELNLDLNSNFNLIIGDNGSGKTAILEALTVAIGSFFLGINGISARGIYDKDIRIATYKHNEEFAFPVVVSVKGELYNQSTNWERRRNGWNNRTTIKEAESIREIALDVDTKVRQGENINLPLLIYYATGRLFDIASYSQSDELGKDNKKSDKKISISSRFRAYNRSLEAKSTHKQFQNWFKGKELSRLQKGSNDKNFEVVKNTIIKCLPNCVNLFYEFDPDKPKGLKIELSDGRILPFDSLSDGTRNFFAIIADMAYKCITLNPHLEEKALETTEGIVLIDELDLHLHPEWQRLIINQLKTLFPSIQFIASTHSPFLIQEAGKGQLIILKDNKIHKIASGNNLSIEDIAEELQYVINPQWSTSRQEMFKIAKEYYAAVKNGTDTPELKAKLDEAMKPFAIDTAFYAIIEQEKIIEEYKKNHP